MRLIKVLPAIGSTKGMILIVCLKHVKNGTCVLVSSLQKGTILINECQLVRIQNVLGLYQRFQPITMSNLCSIGFPKLPKSCSYFSKQVMCYFCSLIHLAFMTSSSYVWMYHVSTLATEFPDMLVQSLLYHIRRIDLTPNVIEISSITTITQCVTSCDCMSVYRDTLCSVETANNKKDSVPNIIMNFR